MNVPPAVHRLTRRDGAESEMTNRAPVFAAASSPAAGRTAVAPGGWRLSRGWRKALLITHLLSGGSWIGIDVMVAVFVFTGRYAHSTELRSVAYRALASFVVGPMLTAALTCLASGVLLGWGSKWGLLRYWWVAVKLVLTIVLCTLILFSLQPGMDAVGAYGRDLPTGTADPSAVSKLFFPPAVSLTSLIFATLLGVLKPWGRTRRGPGRAI